MRYLLMLFMVGVLGNAAAQNTFAGFGVTLVTNFSDISPPLPSLQLGGFVSDTVVVRGVLESLILVTLLGVDVLYVTPLPDSDARGYVGGGADVGVAIVPFLGTGAIFGVHGTAGIEWLTGQLGIFAETQPALYFGGGLWVKLRAGVNVYF